MDENFNIEETKEEAETESQEKFFNIEEDNGEETTTAQQTAEEEAAEDIKEEQLKGKPLDIRSETYPSDKESSGDIARKWLVLTVIIALLLSVLSSFLTALVVSRNSQQKIIIYQSENSGENVVIEQQDYTQLVEKVKNSVVEVYTEAVTYNAYFGNYVTEGAGSGVIISTDGYIVTNNHVINGASSIYVTLANGEKYNAQLVATDVKSDLAVIKIDAKDLQAAVLGNSETIKVGQNAVAIGNPLGTLGGTVTAGIISGLSREVTIDRIPMTLMQINVAISPGNSGGGLFNTNGELIGVVNAKSVSENVEGIGFSIPVDVVKDVATQLIQQGYVTGRAQIGISCVSIDSMQKAWNYGTNSFGVLIKEVTDENAKAGGLQENDLIVAVDNTQISSFSDLQTALFSYTAGDEVVLTVLRNNQQLELKVTLSQKK